MTGKCVAFFALILSAFALNAAPLLTIDKLNDKSTYRALSGKDGISGSLPAFWSDKSAWSGAKVKYSCSPIGLKVDCSSEEGMIQLTYDKSPSITEKSFLKLTLKGLSKSDNALKIGIRANAESKFFAAARIQLSEELKEQTVLMRCDKPTLPSSLMIESFVPASFEISSIKLESIPESEYIPDSVKAVQRDDEDWTARNAKLVANAVKTKPDILFAGDSITQRWETDGAAAWNKYLKPLKTANFGIDGDFTQHLLWRFRNSGIGKDFTPKLVIMLIGVNNTGELNHPDDIIAGLKACVNEVRKLSPSSKILILGILPNGQDDQEIMENIAYINKGYAALSDNKNIFFADIGKSFLKNAKVSTTIMHDYLHLTPLGYEIYGKEISVLAKKTLDAK